MLVDDYIGVAHRGRSIVDDVDAKLAIYSSVMYADTNTRTNHALPIESSPLQRALISAVRKGVLRCRHFTCPIDTGCTVFYNERQG